MSSGGRDQQRFRCGGDAGRALLPLGCPGCRRPEPMTWIASSWKCISGGYFQPRWKTPRGPGARYRSFDAGWRERASRRGSPPKLEAPAPPTTKLGHASIPKLGGGYTADNWSGVGEQWRGGSGSVDISRALSSFGGWHRTRVAIGSGPRPGTRADRAGDVVLRCGTKLESQRVASETIRWGVGGCPLFVEEA